MKRLLHARRHLGRSRKISVAAHAIMNRRRSGLKAWPVVAIFVIQVILFLAHWLVYSTWIAFWPGLSPAALVADLRDRDARRLLSALLWPRCSPSVFPILRSGSSTGSRPSGSACSTFSSGLSLPGHGSPGLRLRVSHLAANPDDSPAASLARSVYLDRGARRHLRPHQCARHSHPPRRRAAAESAGKLARPPRGPAERSASRAHQRRPFLPPCHCARCELPARHWSFIPGDLFDGTQGRPRPHWSPLSKHSLRRSAFTSPPATTRSSRRPRITSRPSTRAGIRVLANEHR